MLKHVPLGLLVVALTPGVAAQAAGHHDWAQVIKRVEPSVVSIKINAPRAFDTEWNFTGEATGFVVDAKRGIILTNRHVVQPGPVVATAIFQDHEQVPLTPIYRDPVHDFGFFHYAPSKLKYIQPHALKLAPHEAQVGDDIRLIGNDAGEQLSILAGTLARLDRNAPYYGQSNYNDFNSFYYQADSATSGGSSGSPVLNTYGHVIALNAGGEKHSSSSYYLPLNRVVPVLKAIQAGQPVHRGTLQTIFLHRTFNQLKRLGLGSSLVHLIRTTMPKASGLLVVNQVIPGGPADGKLQPGDILLSIDNRKLAGFDALGHLLDTHVDDTIRVRLQRNGAPMHVSIKVEDLRQITPRSYLQYGGAVLNNLSYQIARSVNKPVTGVYVADPGFVFANAGLDRGAVITQWNGVPVGDIDTLQKQLMHDANGSRVSIRYYDQHQPQHNKSALLRLGNRWFPARRCHRSRHSHWPCKPLHPTTQAPTPAAMSVHYPAFRDRRKKKLAPSLVSVDFDMPYRVQGVQATHYVGTGLVVDAQQGLVIVDRNTVPVAMGVLTLTFAGTVAIPAQVVYIAPLHNIAVLRYDPAQLGSTPVVSAQLGSGHLKSGDRVWIAGFDSHHRLVTQATTVTHKAPLTLPVSPTLRFRDSNLNTWRVTHAPDGVEGVVTNAAGQIMALWSSFAWQQGQAVHQSMQGTPLWLVKAIIARIKSTHRPTVRTIGAEFTSLSLSKARLRHLPATWIHRLTGSANPDRRVLMVNLMTAGSPAERKLETGDLLLAINSQPVSNYKQLYQLSQHPEITLTVLRHRRVKTLTMHTASVDSATLNRVLIWGGAVLQRPPRTLAAQRHQPRDGVWVAYFNYGSPASRYGLSPGLRIIAVNDLSTPSLDTFLAATRLATKKHATLRLKTVNPNGRVGLVAMQLEPHYWPTYELVRVNGRWIRHGP